MKYGGKPHIPRVDEKFSGNMTACGHVCCVILDEKKEVFLMKLDRLIGILSVLLQTDTVTAPELAERFEVSRRTINRDIESLCKAGIPIVTTQGAGGGISIMDNYKLDKTLLTNGDMRDILAGLRM